MRPTRRRIGLATTVVGLTLTMFGVAAVAGSAEPGGETPPQGRGVAAAPADTTSRNAAAASIDGLQVRLRRLPKDWSAWASLGASYVQAARLSADPSYYAKAEGALAKSREIQPKDNAVALTGEATLAAARHDFARALELARSAQRINAYSAANQGVLVDALVELGRYDQAETELQRMVDLKPGVPSYSRISYVRELRGDRPGARQAMERALAVAYTPSDAAFAAYHLGELAFDQGDLEAAAKSYDEGLARDATYLPSLAGRAKVAAARGDSDAALRDYRTVTERLPQPSYLIEYADLLAFLGRKDEAAQQYALVDASQRLFAASGANVDLELALYDADHGRAPEALAAASAEHKRRTSIFVEDAYAWALHVNGRDREALVHARKAERLGTRNALLAYHRGMIERSLGDKDAARTSLTRALKTNPNFSVLQAPIARDALASLGGSA